jgi:hypothetical protein
MKKSVKFMVAIIAIFSMTVSVFSSDVPLKKTQIDWLISGAGGCIATAGGDPADGSGEFSYKFTSKDGSINGIVSAKNGVISVSGGEAAVELATFFTQHFKTLNRQDHFHATHELSERSTEEYPTHVGSSRFITFGYASLENGGMMSVMILDDKVKFVTELKKTAVSLPASTPVPDGEDGDVKSGAAGVAGFAGAAVLSAGTLALFRKKRG